MKQHFFGLCALALLVGLTGAAPVAALHSVFVAVPNHSEEALTWCGPAVAEMIMEAYPSGSCNETQADAWAEIVLHRTEINWDTDPAGLRGAMMSLCPPPGGGWSIFSRTDASDLMFRVAFWMTKNDYPVAAVQSTSAHNTYAAHEEHWVVIKGIITDQDPTTTSTVTLEHVWITDPSPVTFGDPPLERFMTGGAWYAEFQPVTKAGSTYNGKYVAIIEPPRVEGIARAKLPLLEGRVLPWRQVMELSQEWLERTEVLRQLEPFVDLYRMKPLRPILVDEDSGAYYLVPYSRDGETARHALRFNAYDGSFMEAGAFAPVRYLDKDEAVKRAVKLLRMRRSERVEATLTSQPEAGAASRFHPVWKVELEDRWVAVRQDGTARFWPPKGKDRRPR